MKGSKKIGWHIIGLIFTSVTLFPSLCSSADWSVRPIRVFLERGAKSASITVSNDGNTDLSLKMEPYEWTQDAEGKDQYTATQEVIFYPKSMTLKKGDQRIIRVGVKKSPLAREKTYRLFIRELPPSQQGKGGPSVAVAIRFGAPIFVSPVREEQQGEIESISLTQGTLSLLVKNTGNVHFLINAISIEGKDAQGQTSFAKDMQGWYLLNGASRLYSLPIPKDACDGISELTVRMKSDKLELEKKLTISREQCMP